MDSNVGSQPVVGDIGSCVSAMLEAMGSNCLPRPTGSSGQEQARRQYRKDGAAADEPQFADGLSRRAWVLRTIIKERPDAILVNEGATRSTSRAASSTCISRASARCRTWGVMGYRHGLGHRSSNRNGKPVLAVEGTARSAFPAWR